MPPYHFSSAEESAIIAYLLALPGMKPSASRSGATGLIAVL